MRMHFHAFMKWNFSMKFLKFILYKRREECHENTCMSIWRDKTVQKEIKQIPGGQVNQRLLNTQQLAPDQGFSEQLKAGSWGGGAGEAFIVSDRSRRDAGLGLVHYGLPYGLALCHPTTLHRIHFHPNYPIQWPSPGPLTKVRMLCRKDDSKVTQCYQFFEYY